MTCPKTLIANAEIVPGCDGQVIHITAHELTARDLRPNGLFHEVMSVVQRIHAGSFFGVIWNGTWGHGPGDR